jgi:hypothetical protein
MREPRRVQQPLLYAPRLAPRLARLLEARLDHACRLRVPGLEVGDAREGEDLVDDEDRKEREQDKRAGLNNFPDESPHKSSKLKAQSQKFKA